MRNQKIKRNKETWYKKWADLSPAEKRDEKWKRIGRPHIFWPSAVVGTYISNDPNCIKFLEYMKKTQNIKEAEKVDVQS